MPPDTFEQVVRDVVAQADTEGGGPRWWPIAVRGHALIDGAPQDGDTWEQVVRDLTAMLDREGGGRRWRQFADRGRALTTTEN